MGKRWPSASQEVRIPETSTLLTPWPWTSSLWNCRQINFHCLGHTACGTLLQSLLAVSRPTSLRHCPVASLSFFLSKIFYFILFIFIFIYLFIFLMFSFILWERESACGQVGAGPESGERENPKQAPCRQHRAQPGGQTHEPEDRDLSRSQVLNWLSLPGAPATPFPLWIDPIRCHLGLAHGLYLLVVWALRGQAAT